MANNFSQEQQLAFDKYVSGENIFITGPGGAGKSYLIKKIASHAKKNGKKVSICAMTGCAAILLNCGAKTLHSWAGIGLARGDDDLIAGRIVTNNFKRNNWKYTNLLIVDEVSMLSYRLFNLLDHIGQRVRKNGLPFGGIQLVFCGDFYQLPPIGNEGDPDSSRFCFESPLWNHAFSNKDFETNQIPLKTIFRQKDQSFTKILNQIREGRLTKTPYNTLLSYVGREVDPDLPVKPTILLPTRRAVDAINRTEMEKLTTDIKEFACKPVELVDEEEMLREEKQKQQEKEAEEEKLESFFKKMSLKSSTKEEKDKEDDKKEKPKKKKKASNEQKKRETEFLINNALFEKTLKLRVGAQVMCIANIDMEAGIYNGSQGVIQEFVGDAPVVRFYNGVVKTISPHTWLSENIPGLGVAQIPLILAWAVTIHKSQGATLDVAQIDIGSGIFECGQSYVALSRVKDLSGLYLTSFNPQKIKVNKKVKEYYGELKLLRKTDTKKDVIVAAAPVSPAS